MADPDSTPRKPLSVRTRFEIFKRDDFTCQYCGQRSPDVVLEVDHITPVSHGGTNDTLNLITACWGCNSGKSSVPLREAITSEDPHEKAIEMLERQRQLDEYNRVLAEQRERTDAEVWELWRYWQTERGMTDKADLTNMPRSDYGGLRNALQHCPREQILNFMDAAITRRATKNMASVMVCVRNWRYEYQANRDKGSLY
jgi:hypothetical protein